MSTNRARGTAIPDWARDRPTPNAAGAPAATAPRGGGWLGYISTRRRITVLAAAVALLSGGGIAAWRMAETVPGVDWSDQARARLESVNRQIATVE